jgi:hypothetical protein
VGVIRNPSVPAVDKGAGDLLPYVLVEHEGEDELGPTVKFASTRDTSAEFFRLDQSDESGLCGTVFRNA